jgi:CshA-type fibril repeat protein
MFEASESLSQRGGTTSNFTKTGLITDPGAFISSLEPLTTSGDTECVLYTMGGTLSKCLNRGFVTMTFSEPTLNPVISFAGWGGNDGGARSWSELELVTPGVSLTLLSGTNVQVIGGTYVGVVEPSPGTRCTNSPAAGCGSLQVNGTVTEVKFALNWNANGSGWGNEDQWNLVASVVEDFGQLPSRYDLPAASHVVGLLKLGSVVTADNLNVLYGTTNADAVTNGTAIPANEDGVSSLGALGIENAGASYSLPVSLSGVERAARLCGWIDFNRDGTMTLAERTCATNPATGATSATLNWTIPSDIVAGLTYARIRLSYDAIPLPTSKVSSGEVEDYSITIASSAVPNAVNDTSTNAQDINQVISPLANDNFEAGVSADITTLKLCGIDDPATSGLNESESPNNCTKPSLTIPGEGIYTVNSNGTVTFDPFPSYVGTATPVRYQILDAQLRPSNATITPTVTPSPTATADTTRDYVNVTQSKDILTNDTAGVGVLSPSTAKLCSTGQSPSSCTALTVSVTGGVYTLNTTTGVITFTPTADWVGTAPAVRYQVADGSGQVTTSTYTPTVVSQPIATNDTSSAGYDVTQTISPLLNDTPGGSPLVASTLKLCGIDDPTTSGLNESESPNNCTKILLTIPGEGTYTVNSDGTVTFNPLPTFYGTASPRPYQISDALGETTSANITPSVGTPPLPAAQANTSSGAYDSNQTLSPLDGDTAGSSSFPFQVASIKLCGLADNTVTPAIPAETPNSCSQTTVIVPGEGTYTLDTTTGVVTFNPLSTFTGQVQTPVTYQVKDSLDRYVNSTLTPTVGPPPVPTATADALTSGYDANQTYTPTSNDTPGATDFPLVATSVKLCGLANSSATPPVAAQTPNSCDKTSLTVPNEGTYTVNSDGTVTFDPLTSFTGQVQTPVKYQAKDSLDRFVNTTITPTVGPPPVPTATADAITDAYDTNQTYTPTSNDTPGATDFPLVATSVKLCGLANASASPPVVAETPNTCSKTSLTVPGEGTYTVNSDGTVTFNPLPSFTGQVQTSVRYQAKDSLDRFVNTTITPTVGPPPVPTATADAITDAYDTNQTYSPLGNDSAGATDFPLLAASVKLCGLANASASPPVVAETPNTCSKTSLTVPNEGTYTVNSDGTVTFDPLPSFSGTAQTPVRYQANDSLDRYVNTTITPTVDNPPGPVAIPNTSSGDYNVNQTIEPVANDRPSAVDFPLDATSVKLCGLANPSASPPVVAETPNGCSQTTVTVPGEGTYTLDATTGIVTFDPLPSFTGQVQTPVKYQVKDSLDRYVNSTITPTVGPPPVPTASPDAITDAYDLNQTYTPLDNDDAGTSDFPLIATSVKLCGLANSSATPPVVAETPNTCSKTSMTVPGEGTYTVNSDGTVTFNPLPSFTGEVETPVTYQANDSLNRSISETITPTVGPPPVPTASPDAITDAYDKNQVYTPVTNDTKGAPDFPFVATKVKLCGADDTSTSSVNESVPPNCNAESLTVPGEGTYTVNSDGTVTFDPLSTFTGTVVTVVKYQATDILNRTANSTITPTVTAPAITVVDDTKTGPYDTNQVIAVLTNDTPAAQWDPLSVKLCGLANPSATPPVVAETPNTCSKISLTVTGEGTYTVNTDGTVTFDSLSTFTGQVQTPVTYQVTDVLGRTADANITPTVLPPPPPTASPETKLLLPGSSVAFTTITGTSGLATGTGLATTGATATCLFTPSTTTCDADNSVTITGEGTYVLDPATGIVTFTALSSALSGTKPSITYRVTDIVGQTATSTLTPIIPDPPAATNDVSSGPYDTNQAINPLSNDSFSSLTPAVKLSLKLCGLDPLQTPNSCDKTTLVVPNEGSYTVNPTTGVVTFDPLPSFTGTVATPPTYQVADSVGRYVNAIITPTVSAPDAPTAKPETKLVLPGATISFTTTTGASGLATGTGLATSGPTATCLFTPGTTTCDADNSVTIVGEGTYVLDPATGIVAFTASASIMPGTKTPITYRVTDALGKTAISTLTPIVPAPPTATNDAISDGYDVNQTYTPLANDSFSSLAPVSNITLKLCGVEPVQKPNDCTKSVVTVPNEGTYTLNADGTVTFDPLPTFSGTATPVVYQVADSLGRFVNATITPTVAPPPVPAASLDTGKAKQGSKITLSPWLNDDAGTIDSTGEKLKLVPTSVRLCGITTLEKKDAPGTTGPVVTCNLTTLKTADGTYTVDVKTGKVSFVHKKGFSGTVKEPVKYSIANSFKGAAGPGIATGVLIPTIVPTSVPSVTLGDKVWRDLNGDGYQGPGDGGIEGVTVKLLTVKGKVVKDLFGKTVKPVVSDVNGAFRFTGLPGGRYKLIVTYPPNFRPTIPDRPGRLKNSSTTQAITKVMKIGQTDLSLDFGMVPKMTSGLAHTM